MSKGQKAHAATNYHEKTGIGSQRYQNLPGRGVLDSCWKASFLGKGKGRKPHTPTGIRKAKRSKKSK